MNYKINFSLIYFYVPFLIILAQFILNPVGIRFPDQDLMWHDQVSISRIEFFLQSIKTNIFSVINFSEGFGVDIRSNIKTQVPILDLSIIFSLFLKVNYAITIKMIIYSLIGYFSMYKLLSQNSLCIKSCFLSIMFVLGILFFGESSTLTTISYVLTPFLMIFLEKYKQTQSSVNLLFLQLVTILFISNLDLNALFIMPLIFLWFLDGKLSNLFKKIYIYVGIVFLISFCISQSSTIYYFLTSQTEYSNNNLNNFNIFNSLHHLKLLKTIFAPYVHGPITLYIFSPIFAFVFLQNINKKEYINIYLIILVSLIIYLAPLIFPFLKSYIPSLIRYHFSVAILLLFIIISKIYLRNVNNIKENKSLKLFIALIILTDIWILLNSYNLVMGFLCCFFFTSCSLIFLTNKQKNNYIINFLFPLLHLGFLFCIFNGGSIVPNKRTIDKEYGYFYNTSLKNCIGKYVKGTGIVPIADHPLFPDQGRHDLLLPILERPTDLLGRSFFQWRHSYPKTTSDIYLNAGGKGGDYGTNFFPPAKTAVTKIEFWKFLDLAQTNYIASININLNHEDWRIVGECKSKSSLEIDPQLPEYKKLLYKSFSDTIYIYEKITNEHHLIKYRPTYVEINLRDNNNISEIKLPILYSKDLISNYPLSINIERSKDNFTILKSKNKNFKNNVTIKISSHNLSVFFPYYLLIILIILNLLYIKLFSKK